MGAKARDVEVRGGGGGGGGEEGRGRTRRGKSGGRKKNFKTMKKTWELKLRG